MNETGEKWYLRINGITTGPYDPEKIRERLRRGELPDTAESSSDKRHWQPLKLRPYPVPPQALPPVAEQEPLPMIPAEAGLEEPETEDLSIPPPLTRRHCGAALLGQLWNLPFYREVLRTAPRRRRIVGSGLLWFGVMIVWGAALARFGGKFAMPLPRWPFWCLAVLLILGDLGTLLLLELDWRNPEGPDGGEALTRAAALLAIFFGAAALLLGIVPVPGTAGVWAGCRRVFALYVGFCAVGNWLAGERHIREREFGLHQVYSLYWSALLLLGQCGLLWGLFRLAKLF